ncbi:hypothetical protein SDC9_153136 [bioreactor metagenome]|uniref:Uncharacterized protein n=1 Tax=bioreactor metagenome TaxID=1076179 RepID=A0A645EXC0_9ZZZZ
MLRFLFYRNGFLVRIELHNSKAFRILDMVSEYSSALLFCCGTLQHVCQTAAMVNIVSKNQADRIVTDEFFTDKECLSQPVRAFLHLVFDMDAQICTIAE